MNLSYPTKMAALGNSYNVYCRDYSKQESDEIKNFCNLISKTDRDITVIESPKRDFLFISFKSEQHRNWFLLKFGN